MARVTSDMSMSLDGFITGPNDDVSRPLGEGGERLHQWVYELASWRERHGLAGGKSNRDAEVLDEAWHVGAVGGGKRLFEQINNMEFEPSRVIESPGVTHLRFRVQSRGDRHG